MHAVTVELCRETRSGSGRFGCVGRAPGGARWAWPTRASASAGASTVVGPDAVVVPEPMGSESAVQAAPYWPAWRAVVAASLEIGSRLLVLGDEGITLDILSFARLRGCLWRACLPGTRAKDSAEHLVSTAAGLELLPARPDAVIISAAGSEWLSIATRACADRGTVVAGCVPAVAIDLQLYPDIHRRGLNLVIPGSAGAAGGEAESFARLVRVLELGLVAAQP